MRQGKNVLKVVLFLIFISPFVAFKIDKSKLKIITQNLNRPNLTLTIDTFSEFPPEIDGCSCYFSNNSGELASHKYIYANDFAQTSFMKINGVLTKFTQVSLKKIDNKNTIAKYKSSKFEITLEIKDGKKNGEETMLKTGTITLTDKQGNSIKKIFYGECGC